MAKGWRPPGWTNPHSDKPITIEKMLNDTYEAGAEAMLAALSAEITPEYDKVEGAIRLKLMGPKLGDTAKSRIIIVPE